MSTERTVHLVTLYVPESAAEPMELKVAHSGLRMMLVNRESVGLLDDPWKVLGVYFLLGAVDDPDRFRAYVGEVGKSTLIQRVKQHASQKEWWSRALLIASASDEFNSAEIGWLEGRLYDVLNNAVACEVMNGNRPGDDSLSVRERAVLEKYVEPIMAALRACGASPDTADQKPPPPGKVKRYSESVADLIAAKLLKPETQLRPLRKGLSTPAHVLVDGRLRVDDNVYDSLSAAAKAVSGHKAEPGWDFWGAPSGDGSFVPLTALRERLRANGVHAEPSAPSAPPAVPATPPAAEDSIAPPLVDEEAEVTAPPTETPSLGLRELVAKKPGRFPLPIFATYRGQRLDAVIETDGRVRLGNDVFDSLSTAASRARKQAGYAGTGKAATNGWLWWRFRDDDDLEKPVGALRDHAAGEASLAE